MLLANDDAPGAAPAPGCGHVERLLVRAWRRMALGRGACSIIGHGFAEACGEDGREVLATFVTFLHALAFAGRRPFVIGHPNSLAPTADEQRVLTLVAAAQSHEPVLFEAHLCWLARGEVRPAITIAARALAAALSAHDLILALPPAASTASGPGPRPWTTGSPATGRP